MGTGGTTRHDDHADAATESVGPGPVVRTEHGPVRGRALPGGAVAFRGIRYGAPPTGMLRWRPPEPPAGWSEVRDALEPGPAAWQPAGGPLDGLVPGMAPAHQGDDCLSLDVWTPGVDDGVRPVLVWIHGGAFSLGAGSLPVYDGARLAAEHDVVVVTVNYRLGVFGFLHPDDASATPNVGLLDQVAALRWVRDTIAGFGGDPSNVTVFGESAGGGSVLSLLAMPSATGLFHRAIVQSGATDLLLDREAAALVVDAVARAAGLTAGDVDGLRTLPAAALLEAQATAAKELFTTVGTMPFHPCVDGEVLPTSWLDAAARGVNPVPLVIGTTRDEMALFSAMDPRAAALDDAGLRRRLDRAGHDTDLVVDAYRTVGVVDPPHVWSRVQTDTQMWVPAQRLAEAHARHAPVWVYRFDRPAADPRLGACHGVDIPFPFGTTDTGGWGDFLGDQRSASALSAVVRRLWTAFARHGRPDTESVDWPAHGPDRATLLLDDAVTVVHDPDAAVRRLWSDPQP
ncbi:carboxylesterase/lipase family protein [Rhabdothermincola salaria]|uniref:carboxylesterase/lipase family protein n=1 Tax=Rhabdothermincola salaria TaxID=2903142 RepID=UPI001E5F9A0B|nr:carboxylesterase/lipase family protein [Rhabdothermincola salaria]MCD9624013.1 carboxylesterase/lipase family protein [Rhabdothermincola salaria]